MNTEVQLILRKVTVVMGMVISDKWIYAVLAKEEENLLYVLDAFKEERKGSVGADVKAFLEKYSLEKTEAAIVFLAETKHYDERVPNLTKEEVEKLLLWEEERVMPWDRKAFIADYILTALENDEEKQLYISAVSRDLLGEAVMGMVKGRGYLSIVDAWPAPLTHVLGEKEELASYVVALVEEDCVSFMAFLGSGIYDCVRVPMTAQALDAGMAAVDSCFCNKRFPAPSGVMISAIGPDEFVDSHYQNRYLDLGEDQSNCLSVEEAVEEIEKHWPVLPLVDLHFSKNAQTVMGNVAEVQWQSAMGLCLRQLRHYGKTFNYA